MKKTSRYDPSGSIEAQFEPGSRGRVLRNIPGIKRKREMDRAEFREYVHALEKIIGIYEQDQRLTADDVCKIHKLWLGSVYEWAGRYRSVNASKEGFMFAAAAHIPRLMSGLERGPLYRFTPCIFESRDEIIKALAVVHTELILIHPFRDGNGRLARLIATLMAWQAGLPNLDFGGISGKKRQEYFSAVRAGLDYNYEPMIEVFDSVIQRTLRGRK